MVTIEILRKVALSFPEATEEPHFEKISFRVKKKIFATYDEKNQRVCIKLSEIDQDIFSLADKTIVYPVDSKWGKQGWTLIEMNKVHKDLFVDALTTAYCEVAPKKLADQIRLNYSITVMNKNNNMEQYKIETDIQVMFLSALKFPNDVPNTFTKLEQAILDKTERRYFGFSLPNKDGEIQYKACAEILKEDEAINYGLAKMTIKAGQYASIFIKNHYNDARNIPNALGMFIELCHALKKY